MGDSYRLDGMGRWNLGLKKEVSAGKRMKKRRRSAWDDNQFVFGGPLNP